MPDQNFEDSFLKFCKLKKFDINDQQIEVINLFDRFINSEKNFFNYLFKNRKKLCFYLHGNVGVGKTMLLNFIYDNLKIKKLRLHFNEFMINFHDFRHEGISRLFEKGWSIQEVALVSGHQSWSSLKRYANLKEEIILKKL